MFGFLLLKTNPVNMKYISTRKHVHVPWKERVPFYFLSNAMYRVSKALLSTRILTVKRKMHMHMKHPCMWNVSNL